MNKLLYGRGVVSGSLAYIGQAWSEGGDSDDYDVVGNQKSYRIIRGYRGDQIVTVQEEEENIIYYLIYIYTH